MPVEPGPEPDNRLRQMRLPHHHYLSEAGYISPVSHSIFTAKSYGAVCQAGLNSRLVSYPQLKGHAGLDCAAALAGLVPAALLAVEVLRDGSAQLLLVHP